MVLENRFFCHLPPCAACCLREDSGDDNNVSQFLGALSAPMLFNWIKGANKYFNTLNLQLLKIVVVSNSNETLALVIYTYKMSQNLDLLVNLLKHNCWGDIPAHFQANAILFICYRERILFLNNSYFDS